MRRISCILLVILLACTSVHGAVRDRVVDTYTKELGVREKTGNNDGQRVEMYLRSVGLGKGSPWCAAFVSWVYQQCGVENPKSAWSPDWFRKNVIYKSGKVIQLPTSGDVFGIYFASKNRVAHVGFIHKWGDKYVETVEGNTNEAGSREGDGVYKKKRLTRQVYVVSRYIK